MKINTVLTLLPIIFCVYHVQGAMASDSDTYWSECPGKFTAQTESDYALPYLIGELYVVGQGNCTDGSHESDQAYAYDFDMPLRTPIVASRDGRVIQVEERYTDTNNRPGQENFVLVLHHDNTVAGYYHLTLNGSLVAVGDNVKQGSVIALSGNTGDSSEPHLHFEVLECLDCDTLPTNFKNTRAHDSGLIEGEQYRAL